MLIGHGSFDEFDYKFNLPGPDLTATELAGLLDKIPAHQTIVNMTSASGGSIAALEKPKRVIITATKTGTEKNATVFPRYWIEGLRDPAADADKNDIVTALEAFRYAEEKTAKFYETQKRLSTEHALIEDAGKGEGVKVPSAENGEGLMAGRFAILHLGATAAQSRSREAGSAKAERGTGAADRRSEISEGLNGGAGISPTIADVAAPTCADAGGARQMKVSASSAPRTAVGRANSDQRSKPCATCALHGDPGATACYKS